MRPGGVMLGCEAYPEELGYNGLEKALTQFSIETEFITTVGGPEPWQIVAHTSHMFYLQKSNEVN